MERVDRDSQNSNFGDHPESQTGTHITYNAYKRHTITHIHVTSSYNALFYRFSQTSKVRRISCLILNAGEGCDNCHYV